MSDRLASVPVHGYTYLGAAHDQDRARKHVAGAADLTGEQAKGAVDSVFDAIGGELVGGRDVAIAGFGEFSVAERAARQGRNPATGETIQIAASRGAKFSAATALKQLLNS